MMGFSKWQGNDVRPCEAGLLCIRSRVTAAAGNGFPISRAAFRERSGNGRKSMARSLSIIGFLALAVGLLWIGQGTGAIPWPASSFMINQLQWAGYGAVLSAVGLILIWLGNR
jgi:hypothetical protein